MRRKNVIRKSAGGAKTVTLRGALMDDGIPVKAGWNWIGPARTSAMPVSGVGRSGGFADDDIIKGSNSSATYYDGQWWLSTFSIEPGVGYKMNLSNGGTVTFRDGEGE